MPTSLSQVRGLSGSRVSMLTATTSKLGPPSLACSASSAGISLRQGTHQVAHRLSRTVRPRQSARWRSAPPASRKARSGSRIGCVGDRARPRPRRARAARGAAPARPAPAGGIDAAIACNRLIPYTAAKPDGDAGKAAGHDHDKALCGVGSLLLFAGRSYAAKPRWTCHEQQDVGRALRRQPRCRHGGDQCLHRFRPAPVPAGHRREQGPRRDARQTRHHHGRRCRARSRTV